MDPNKAWRELSDAFQAGDWGRYTELAAGLLEWQRKGGYPPTISKHQDFDRIVVEHTCQGILAGPHHEQTP